MTDENKKIDNISLIPDEQDPAEYFREVTGGLNLSDMHDLLSNIDGGSVMVASPESAEGDRITFKPQEDAGFMKSLAIEGAGYSSLLTMNGEQELQFDVGQAGEDSLKGTFKLQDPQGKDFHTGVFDINVVPSSHWDALRITKELFEEEKRQQRAQRTGGGILQAWRKRR